MQPDVTTQQILLPEYDVSLFIKREDLIHPFVSGNKFRKLKYNLVAAEKAGQQTVLTFGGAYSNHIAAVAYAAKENGFRSIGIIRGEEIGQKAHENPTLSFALECGMQLDFISRDAYRLKDSAAFLDHLTAQFGDFYLVPEGGTNTAAVKGCSEILNTSDAVFDFICCPVGTGGTLAGIALSALSHQKVLGFPALKGLFLEEVIRKFAPGADFEFITGYEFGGYAKINEALVCFINAFYEKYAIPLDPVYTGKMVFGVMDMIRNGKFPKGSKILMVHTGGLQGIKGMNLKLAKKQISTLTIHV